MNRFVIQPSTQLNGWVLTDTEHGVVVTFHDGKFNETQKVTALEDVPNPSVGELAHIMQEIGEWAARYHGSKCFAHPYGFEYDEQENLYLYRRNAPRWRMMMQDHVDSAQLAATLRKAAEYLTKGLRQKGEI